LFPKVLVLLFFQERCSIRLNAILLMISFEYFLIYCIRAIKPKVLCYLYFLCPNSNAMNQKIFKTNHNQIAHNDNIDAKFLLFLNKMIQLHYRLNNECKLFKFCSLLFASVCLQPQGCQTNLSDVVVLFQKELAGF
jgi:hypothetical protein